MLLNSTGMPDGYSVYSHQVAGHRFETGKQGMLLDNNGRILKPIQTPPRGKKEVEFYQTVFGCEFNESIAKLRQFVPTFYGIEHVALPKLSQGDDNYIILENLTSTLRRPCILDIKIGQRVTDHFATKAKQERAVKKYPEQEKFGFRILGMKVYQKSTQNFISYDKEFGKRLKTQDEILTGLATFFQMGDHGKEHVEEFLLHLEEIYKWCQDQRIFRLFSSSILLMYEGDTLQTCTHNEVVKDLENDCNGQEHYEHFVCSSTPSIKCKSEKINSFDQHVCTRNEPLSLFERSKKHSVHKVIVKMVDFAHTDIGNFDEPDINYMYGINNLIYYMQQLIIGNS